MPPRGYRHVSLRVEVYERLEEIKRERGLSSINDVVVLLLDHFDISSKLDELLRATAGANHATSGGSAKKRSLREVLEERGGLEFLSDMKLRNPEKFVEKARREGLVVVEGYRDTLIATPEAWEQLKRELERLRDPEPSSLRDKVRRAVEFLYMEGLIYYDSDARKWRFVENV